MIINLRNREEIIQLDIDHLDYIQRTNVVMWLGLRRDEILGDEIHEENITLEERAKLYDELEMINYNLNVLLMGGSDPLSPPNTPD